MIRENVRSVVSGLLALAILVPVLILLIYLFVTTARAGGGVVWSLIGLGLLIAADVVGLAGVFVVNPNEGKVLQLFGAYTGTVKTPGLRWANPFYSKRRISLRIRNFESQHLKVNDIEGNPIEIAAVVVWRVVETAEACFEVDNYENFVHVQSEAALRNLASNYPYDSHKDEVTSLRGQTAAVAEHLKHEIQDRLAKAGVEVIEARISHLAYAPEIAAAMLQRQQAGAIIAARQRIVEGAVGMVEMALERMSQKEILRLDEDRRATMVSNLLIVLCGERAAQPVINAGTLYQ
ncbi:MAG: SPFH domain-containing protein [Acidobacteria bacterium]|nr:SPFH domain-containing protein [Acidobacteriota bacterium]